MLALLTVSAAVGFVGMPVASAAVADAPSVTWQVNGRVAAILRVGDIVYVGGVFTTISTPPSWPGPLDSKVRNNAAAFSATTGAPTNWDPNVTVTPGSIDGVQSLAASADGSVIYLGGDFVKIGGVQHTKLAAVNATTGTPISTFNAGANAQVRALGLIGDHLYAGGSFTQVSNAGLTNPASRGALAEFDAVSNQASDGTVLSWNPGPTSCSGTGCGSGVRALTIPNKNQIVVGGGFDAIQGHSSTSIASLDASSGALLPWSSHPSTPVLALDNDGRYVYGANKTNQAIRYRATDGQDMWRAQADGDIQALALFDGILYIGGHFQNVNGVPEPHAAALIASNGQRVDWGGGADSAAGIFAMEGNAGLFIGGDFSHVPNNTGIEQKGYAQFAEVPPTVNGPLFSDDFSKGTFAAWDTVGKNFAIDPLSFDQSQPGATGQFGLAYAVGSFQVSSLSACAKESVSVVDPGTSGVSLLTLKTYTGKKLAHVFMTTSRGIEFANDVTNDVFDPGVQLPLGWHTIELCGTKGTHGSLRLYVDGSRVDQSITAPSDPADQNLGTDSFAQVEVGDRAKTGGFAFSVDDVDVEVTH
jgi:hypothetical protein